MKEWFKAAILAMTVSLGVVSAYGTYSYSLAYKDEKQFDGLKKTSWDGWLFNGAGKVIGTLSIDCAKPTAAGYKVKASALLMGSAKKLSFSGICLLDATTFKIPCVTGKLLSKTGETLDVNIFQYNTWGSLTRGSETYDFDTGRRFASDKAETRTALLAQAQGNYVMACWAEPTVGSFRGFVGLTIMVNAKGKAKISGYLPDGSKVSTTVQAVYDDQNGVFVPVFAQVNSKKGFFGGYLLCLSKEAEVKNGNGFWDGLAAKTARSATLLYQDMARVSNATGPLATTTYLIQSWTPQGGWGKVFGDYDGQEIIAATVPGTQMTFQGKKFNPIDQSSKLKLSYKDKTGELTGSFKLQTTSGKTYSSKIAGVFINGFGYMSGFTKGKGSIGLAIK